MESLRSSGDFRELLSLFNDEGVRYLIVDAFALAHFGRPRYTKDLDIWVDPTPDNPSRVFRALARFGAPLEKIAVDDFADEDAFFRGYPALPSTMRGRVGCAPSMPTFP